MLLTALVTGGVASLLMPAAPGLWLLAGASVLLGAAVATTGAMVMSMLATEVPPVIEREAQERVLRYREMASGHIAATADPPEEPPGARLVSHGLLVVP